MEINYEVLVGAQHGDEGKGKVTQALGDTGKYNVCARWNGGGNAGHTMKMLNPLDEEVTVVTNLTPSGIVSGIKINLVGPGCAVDPVAFKKELQRLKNLGLDIKTVYLSELAKVTTMFELATDKAQNGEKTIGSTLKGIGPTIQNFVGRIGLRVKDVLDPDVAIPSLENYKKRLKQTYQPELLITPDESFNELLESIEWIEKNTGGIVSGDFFLSGGELSSIIKGNKVNVLLEGAQALELDPCYGDYPYATSTPCLATYAWYGAGLPGYAKLNDVHCVFKGYTTRVGNGKLTTELLGEEAEMLRMIGGEFGATTGRPRRPGWLNLPELKRACEFHGATKLYMTKVDILGQMPDIKVCTSLTKTKGKNPQPVYKIMESWGDCKNVSSDISIPTDLFDYIRLVEHSLERPVDYISVGPGADQLVSTRPLPKVVKAL